jgi:hypothetical protein
MLLHPAIEVRLVNSMTLLDLLCAGKFLVFLDIDRHDDAPCEFFRNVTQALLFAHFRSSSLAVA